MKKNVKLKLLAMRIEYHWRIIMGYRFSGNQRIEAGERYTSEIIVDLSNRISKHSSKLMKLNMEYERALTEQAV